ncbi:MAG: hypothetical protein ABFR82_05120 [Nitrospirota bacterium]
MGYDFTDEANLTDDQLAGELAKLTPLTIDEITDILPEKVDKEHFKQLIDIVRSAESQNDKLVLFKDNVEKLGGVALTVLGKLLKFV